MRVDNTCRDTGMNMGYIAQPSNAEIYAHVGSPHVIHAVVYIEEDFCIGTICRVK